MGGEISLQISTSILTNNFQGTLKWPFKWEPFQKRALYHSSPHSWQSFGTLTHFMATIRFFALSSPKMTAKASPSWLLLFPHFLSLTSRYLLFRIPILGLQQSGRLHSRYLSTQESLDSRGESFEFSNFPLWKSFGSKRYTRLSTFHCLVVWSSQKDKFSPSTKGVKGSPQTMLTALLPQRIPNWIIYLLLCTNKYQPIGAPNYKYTTNWTYCDQLCTEYVRTNTWSVMGNSQTLIIKGPPRVCLVFHTSGALAHFFDSLLLLLLLPPL